MSDEKKELTPEQQIKVEEYLKLQKETQEKILKVGKQLEAILEENGLTLSIDQRIIIVPKQK